MTHNDTTDHISAAGSSWLTFFGTPALLGDGEYLPLDRTKYRKGILLLAFLSAKPWRTIQREYLADLLWPDLDASAGRRNLRVVLSDLMALLNTTTMRDTLCVYNDSLSFRPSDRLYNDEAAFKSAAFPLAGERWQSTIIERIDGDAAWLDIDTGRTAPDFEAWVLYQRTRMENLRLAALNRWTRERQLAQAARSGGGASGRIATLMPPDDATLTLTYLALLRLETEPVDDSDQPSDAWRKTLPALADEAAALGGQPVCIDAAGCTFAFGVGTLTSGYRWQAFRAACNLVGLIPAGFRWRFGLAATFVAMSGDEETPLWGHGLKRVERIAMVASPGMIVADASFEDMAHGLGLRLLDVRRLPGSETETRLYGGEISPCKMPNLPVPAGADIPFVGREHLMAALGALPWEGPRTQIVVLHGGFGIGKTRTAWEFARQCADANRPVLWLACRSELANRPWAALYEWATRQLVSTASGQDWKTSFFGTKTKEDTEANAFAALILRRDLELPERAALFRMLVRVLETPALLVVDDAPWCDEQTAQLLAEVCAAAGRGLVLAIRRDGLPAAGFRPPDGKPMAVPALDDAAARELLDELSRTHGLPAANTNTRIVHSRCIPAFFVAELPDRLSAMSSESMQIGFNAVRDHLPELHAAAVLGMGFSRDELASVVPVAPPQEALDAAADSGLLLRQGDEHWSFFHPSIRESLLRQCAPAELRRIASVAAALYTGRNEDARAASLLEQAGNSPAARHAWQLAGERALAAEDVSAACEAYAQVARLGYPDDPAAGASVRLHHARALLIRDGHAAAAVQNLCFSAIEFAASTQDAALEQEVTFSANALLLSRLDDENNTEMLSHAEHLRAQAHTPAQVFAATWAKGHALFHMGRLRSARRTFENALAQAEGLDAGERRRYFAVDPWVASQAELAWLLWLQGEPDWRDRLVECGEKALLSSHRLSACCARCYTALVSLCAGDDAVFADAAHGIAMEENFGMWESLSALLLAIRRARDGNPPNVDALSGMEERLRRAWPLWRNGARWLAAEALLAAGNAREALLFANRALADAKHSPQALCLMDIHRLRAQAFAALGHRDEAAKAWKHAFSLAARIGAHGWRARWQSAILQ